MLSMRWHEKERDMGLEIAEYEEKRQQEENKGILPDYNISGRRDGK